MKSAIGFEPLIQIPLSEYNRLKKIEDSNAQPNFTVGMQYELEEMGVAKYKLYCQSFDPTGYCFIADNHGERKRFKIKLITN